MAVSKSLVSINNFFQGGCLEWYEDTATLRIEGYMGDEQAVSTDRERFVVEESMIARWRGYIGKGESRFCALVHFYLTFKVTKINPVFVFLEYICFTLRVNDLNILFFFFQFYSCFFTYKENGPFLNTELGFMLLKLPVHWVICTPSK